MCLCVCICVRGCVFRQKMQIEAKNAKGKKLSPEEDELKKEVDRLVDKAPCYFEGSSGNPIYSWQIKSLKKILAQKVCVGVVFYDFRIPVLKFVRQSLRIVS